MFKAVRLKEVHASRVLFVEYFPTLVLVLHVATASLSLVNAFIITKHFADYIWNRDTTKRCLCKCFVLFCFVSLWISFRKSAVSDGYLTMNVDRYSVMPRKILTAFDFG